MELCKGGELFNAIASRKRYTESDSARVVRSILSVLHYMNHRGLMHRDLKPENVVLVNKQSLTAVRVVDFGQAASFTGENREQATILFFGSSQTPIDKRMIFINSEAESESVLHLMLRVK